LIFGKGLKNVAKGKKEKTQDEQIGTKGGAPQKKEVNAIGCTGKENANSFRSF